MVDLNITTMSSKGQVVIPFEMRKDLSEGTKMIIIRNKNQFILKKIEEFSKNVSEDVDFAERTEKAWKLREEGKFLTKSKEDFLKELDSL